ncbi:MAG: LEA type 2 family protein [Chitinophagaceae bacterium]
MLQQNMKQTGLILAGCVGALLLFSSFKRKTRAIEFLQFHIKGVKIDNANVLTTRLLITVAIENPSSEDLPFDRFFGKVTANGYQLTSFLHDSSKSGIVIAANSSTPITFPVYVQNITLLQQLVNTIKTKDTGDIVIDGTIDVAGIQFPINTTFRLNLAALTGGAVKGVGDCLQGVLN